MSIDQIKDAVKALTPTDFQLLLGWVVGDERDRRNSAPAVAAMVEQLQEAGQLAKPEAATAETPEAEVPEWQAPNGDITKQYHAGDRVKHGGKIYLSTYQGLNGYEPGAFGVDSGIWAEEVKNAQEAHQPAGNEWQAGVDYAPGDIVSYHGHEYQVTMQTHSDPEHTPDAATTEYEKIGE